MANIWGNTSAENILEARFSWSTRKWNIWKKRIKICQFWKIHLKSIISRERHIIYFLKILKGWPPKCFKIPFNLTRSLEFSSFFYLDHFPNNLWAKRISAKKICHFKIFHKISRSGKIFFNYICAWYLLINDIGEKLCW